MLGVFCAVAYVSVFVFRIKVSFLTFDIKDVVITIGAMIFGPLSAVMMSATVSVLEMVTVSETGPYGFIMNFASSVAFSYTAALIYKQRKTIYGAIMGLLSGCICMTSVMLLANLIITPFYMGVSVGEVTKLIPALLLPFNLIKSFLNAAIIFLIYKPVVNSLRKARLIPNCAIDSCTPDYMLNMKVTAVAAVVIILSLVLFFVGFGGSAEWFTRK